MRRTGWLFVIPLMLLGAGSALAGPVAIGTPTEAGSWTLDVLENGYSNFYQRPVSYTGISVWGIVGNTFKSPTFMNIGRGWNLTNEFYGAYPTAAAIGGSRIAGDLSFTFYFAGQYSTPFSFKYGLWDGGNRVGEWSIGWRDNCFIVTPTPEPAEIVLLGIGFCGAAFLSWRRRH